VATDYSFFMVGASLLEALMKPNVSQFDQLPDSALVPVNIFSAVLNAGDSTIWRRAKNEPNFPQPRRYGSKCTRWKVGDIRAFIAGKAAQ
jgi:predicted DNA-binding transcriptional regulator AlpA